MIFEQEDTFADASQRLHNLIVAHFIDYPLEDLILDAMPVRRQSDGTVLATAILAYPRGQSERTVGCMYPRVTELA